MINLLLFVSVVLFGTPNMLVKKSEESYFLVWFLSKFMWFVIGMIVAYVYMSHK